MIATNPRKVGIFLISAIALLIILHVTSYINFYINELGVRDWFFRKFNLNEETNFPTIFSTILHLSASFLLFSLVNSDTAKKTGKLFFISLGIIFFFLGFDELLRLHENASSLIMGKRDFSGFFHHSWVIIYGTAVLILGLAYLRSLLKLPKRTIRTFILAGAIFLLGAIGLEMVAGWYIDTNNIEPDKLIQHRTIPLVLMYSVEEIMEMSGIALFIFELVGLRKLNFNNA